MVPPWLQLMVESLPTLLWAGLVFTIPLTLLSFALGLALGLGTALLRLFGPRPLALLARFYVWVFRGTPLLVQLFVIFYGLPSVGIYLDAFPAALIGFTLHVGAYGSEMCIRDSRKGDPEFVAALDKALDEIKADGTYQAIADKYFGQDVLSLIHI